MGRAMEKVVPSKRGGSGGPQGTGAELGVRRFPQVGLVCQIKSIFQNSFRSEKGYLANLKVPQTPYSVSSKIASLISMVHLS